MMERDARNCLRAFTSCSMRQSANDAKPRAASTNSAGTEMTPDKILVCRCGFWDGARAAYRAHVVPRVERVLIFRRDLGFDRVLTRDADRVRGLAGAVCCYRSAPRGPDQIPALALFYVPLRVGVAVGPSFFAATADAHRHPICRVDCGSATIAATPGSGAMLAISHAHDRLLVRPAATSATLFCAAVA